MTCPPPSLTRTHRALIGIVATGAATIATIGFVGSYSAVRALAIAKGFGAFADVFPLGIDAGIVVLLALDLLLTWLHMPYPLLRHTAWLLTLATIAFNAAAAWPDPLGVGMHASIPVLFIITVEAARHAVGRLAAITADRHVDGVPLWRWLLAPLPTFILWRRMRLWQIRSYPQAVAQERERAMAKARLRRRYGWRWWAKAPEDAVMALKLTRYGQPLNAATLTPPATETTVETARQPTTEAATGPAALPRVVHVPVQVPIVPQLTPVPLPELTSRTTTEPTNRTTTEPTSRRTAAYAANSHRLAVTEPVTPMTTITTTRATTETTPGQRRQAARRLNRRTIRETGRPVTVDALREALGLSRREAQALRREVVDTGRPTATDPTTEETDP